MAVVKDKITYVITNDDKDYHIKLDAQEFTTQNSSYIDADGNPKILNNQSNVGYLGSGTMLKKKKKITINSNLRNMKPSIGSDENDVSTKKIHMDYFITFNSDNDKVFQFEDDKPADIITAIKLVIEFK